ncbi:hypothetical protein E2P81_ATG07475 [Venturia nashicola]|uniref:Uncharacterized protein n=1 Tax=Venturia nashicola TaxID=86259 RepID=A0A4Z1NW79_9PEZI|nr:hypothetical protein E6O75_ATG07631 [Venturia nashicola]TLD31985.1 hypothetical protein E2P81_ATG07475 [Venturia nashicola]
MAPMGLRTTSSRPIICAASSLTFALLSISTTLLTIDAATAKVDLSFWKGIAVAAIILDILALLSNIALTVLGAFVLKQWTHRWLLPWLAAILVVMASSLAIVSLVLKKTVLDPEDFKSNISVDLQLALWSLATLAQLVFYIIIGIHWNVAERRLSFIDEKPATKKTPPIPEPPPTPLRMIAPPYALPETGKPAPDFDTSEEAKKRRSKDSRGSWRDSIHQALHTRPSQKRLLPTSRRSSLSRDSSVFSYDTHSVVNSFEHDSFDNWDTKNFDTSLRDALAPIIPTTGRTLETIPGSRPSSPGKPLDGPFKNAQDRSGSPTSSLIERPTTAVSHRPERPATAQSNYSRRTFIPPASPRGGSPDISESHIHPLFRSDSPTPPPAATPGTIVIAHTNGGQVMPQPPPRSASRVSGRISRQGSRNPSPATTYRATRDSRNASPATTYRASRDSRNASPADTFRTPCNRSTEPRPPYSSIAEHGTTSNFRPNSDIDTAAESQFQFQPQPRSRSRSGTLTSLCEDRSATMTSVSTYNASSFVASLNERSVFNTPTERSRDSSPTRPMTPPIPEFILSASTERLSSKSVETLKSLRGVGIAA